MTTPCIDNYRDLPLGLYEQICAVRREEDIDYQIAVLALLTGQTERDILDLPIGDYSRLAKKAAFLYTAPEADTLPRVADAYKVNGWELIPTKDLRKITAAQYIDFQEYTKKPDEAANLAPILSCFLIPRGCKYNDGYDVLEVQTAIRELSVADVLAVSAFFFRQYAALMLDTRTSLERLASRERNPGKRAELEARMERMREMWKRLTAGGGFGA